MGQKNTRLASPELEALLRRFDHWRQSGRKGRKIPDELWRDAAELARTYSINRVAQSLGLDYNGLKRRVSKGAHPEEKNVPHANGPGFVELSMDAIMEKRECILEFTDWRGQLTIHLKGHSTADVVMLAKALTGGGQ
jgi:hypothetical protein